MTESALSGYLCSDHQHYQLHVFPTYYVEDPSRRKYPYESKGDTPEADPLFDAVTHLPTPRARQVFGLNLRHARRLKCFTQKQFAAMAGVSRSYIGEVERGHHNICINRMEALALAMGQPLRELLDATYHTPHGYRRRH